MANRNLVLSGAALAGVLLATAPSMAQTYPRESTPAERAQTERLNAEQASQPDVVIVARADDKVPADVAAYNAQVAQANAQSQAQYDAQLRDYQQKKQTYEQQHQNYQQQLGAYQDRLANPPPVVVEERHVVVHDAPVVVEERRAPVVVEERRAPVIVEEHVVPFPGRNLVELHDLANPDRDIGGLPVADRAGVIVGKFGHMTYQDQGREKAVITLNNNKSIAITGEHLRLDPNRDTVVADLTYDELNSMPARF